MKKLFTLIFTALFTGTAFAQIPNAGFESWTHVTTPGTYDTPDSWGNTNPFTYLSGIYTCQKGTPGFVGASYLKLTSKTVPIVGVVPGIAVTGTINATTFTVSGGFPMSTRPARLKGEWQYMAFGADTGHIVIFLSKWNTATSKKDTVAFTDYRLPGMVMSWDTFSIALNYYSGKFPDTAMILLSASGTTPVNNSYLYVDTLGFAGTVPSGVVTVKNNASPTVIYPNPTKGSANIFYYSITGGALKVDVTDLSGRLLKQCNKNIAAGENTVSLNVADLPHGVYVVRLTDDEGGTQQEKLTIE